MMPKITIDVAMVRIVLFGSELLSQYNFPKEKESTF